MPSAEDRGVHASQGLRIAGARGPPERRRLLHPGQIGARRRRGRAGSKAGHRYRSSAGRPVPDRLRSVVRTSQWWTIAQRRRRPSCWRTSVPTSQPPMTDPHRGSSSRAPLGLSRRSSRRVAGVGRSTSSTITSPSSTTVRTACPSMTSATRPRFPALGVEASRIRAKVTSTISTAARQLRMPRGRVPGATVEGRSRRTPISESPTSVARWCGRGRRPIHGSRGCVGRTIDRCFPPHRPFIGLRRNFTIRRSGSTRRRAY